MDFGQVRQKLLDKISSIESIQKILEDVTKEIGSQAVVLSLNSMSRTFFASDWTRCKRHCKTLLDIIWEHLNTGHWKDVHLSWRRAFTLVSFLLAVAEFAMRKEHDDLRDVIRICDMGLLMGAPLMNNVLARLADELHRNLRSVDQSVLSGDDRRVEDDNAAKRSRLDPVDHELLRGDRVTVERCPSLERFLNDYMSTGTPVIIRNCMDHWPSMCERRWSTDYLRAVAGCRLVPVELGSQYTDDAWSQTLITVDEFIDQYVELRSPPPADRSRAGRVGYLAQHQLFDQIPRLRKDIVVPDYCALSVSGDDGESDENVDINAWFGPAGTVSPLHRDAKHNLLSQVVGRKYVRLYEREETARLYPFSSPLLETTSQVDVENPDLARFPLFDGLKFKDCFLSEGEMLYIPALYWHFVRSLSVSFSVSFWWN